MIRRAVHRFVPLALTALVVLGAVHCGPSRPRTTVRVPPRIDLASLERIGVVEFRAEGDPDLGRLATLRFTESARRDQGLVRMLDLGEDAEVLDSLGRSAWDPQAYRDLGATHDVRTILVGRLDVSRVRPGVRVARGLGSGSLSMQLRADLEVRLVEAESGASLWTRSATATGSLGRFDVREGADVRITTADPEETWMALVDDLVARVTDDFHVHWERR